MVLGVVGLRTWAAGDGFHALHWNMLSLFGFCTKMLRGFFFGCVVRVVAGGCMLWLGRSGVDRFVGRWVCGVLTSRCLAFSADFVLGREEGVGNGVGCG